MPGWASSAIPSGYGDEYPLRWANNLDRIPNIDLNGSTGTHFEISQWPWRNKADDYQIRDDVSITKGNHQIEFGGSWSFTRRSRICLVRPRVASALTVPSTGNDFADFLLGDANYQELAVQDKGRGTTFPGLRMCRMRVNRKELLNLGLRWTACIQRNSGQQTGIPR